MSMAVAPPGEEAPKALAKRRIQARLERSQKPKDIGRFSSKVIIGLAVVTLSMGLALLMIITRLDLNRVEDAPPGLAMSADSSENSAQVLRADLDLRWSELVIDGDCAPLLNGRPLLEQIQAPVRAGDVLSCSDGSTLEIASTQAEGGTTLFEAKFS